MRSITAFFGFILLFWAGVAEGHTFRDPNQVCNVLEKEGFTLAEPWQQNAWQDYACATAYFPLSKTNTVPTNISYYAESEQSDEVAYVYLVLNINDDGFRQQGKAKYLKTVDTLFRGLELKKPEGMDDALASETPKQFEEDEYNVNFEVLRGATDTLRLTIRNRRG